MIETAMLRRPVFLLTVAIASQLIASAAQGPHDNGAAAAWLKINKLRTTASVMHITAHPDDEQGGLLASLSHGEGARVTLLTLNRGESGDNAIGPQLFDALGLIRTEELLAADRYYGVDQQYFTTVVDYGFSKTLEETMAKWGRERALRDVVRVIRMERPTVIMSRFHGSERDGHGNHQAAGLLAQEGFRAAADPARFADQLKEGLRPWQAKKLYVGGMQLAETWNLRPETHRYSPPLGDTFENFARRGLSFQRSQNGGRVPPLLDFNWRYYRLVDGPARIHEATALDGLSRGLEPLLGAAGKSIDAAVNEALASFRVENPSLVAPTLANGLRMTRLALASATDEEIRLALARKEQQFQDAISAALGLTFPALTNPPVMPPPVPGQTFTVELNPMLQGSGQFTIATMAVTGERGWNVEELEPFRFKVTLAEDAPPSTRPYFYRNGLQESHYTLRDASQFGRPVASPPLMASAQYFVGDVPVEMRVPVMRREIKTPYGEVLREVRSVPRLAVMTSPSHAIVQTGQQANRPTGPQGVSIEVSLLHNADSPTSGQLTLRLPAGWTSAPASQPFSFARSGERSSYRFTVTPSSVDAKPYQIEAVASAAGKEYREGYELIDHRDLELRYLYRPSTTEVRGVDVTTVAGLKVGYVMGIGDSVPQGLQQLGAQVTLLGERELASSDLSQFDTIMTGTRAYAVRDDLKTYNSRLLDYVKAGGNMIVLYNTQELVPNSFAPFPGELPRSAEEVSEEDSPVTILAPAHQSFTWPNRITAADFDGWVEQRGSKFFTKWDAAYTPMISTFDRNQPPQSGGWLTAKVGKGNWTYFAYALHRQLPYGVPGAYRITANLLALNKQPR